MAKKQTIFFTLITASLFLFNCAWADPLKFAACKAPPFMFKDSKGKWQGIDIEIIKELAKRMKVKIDFIPCSWKRCLYGMEKGQFDIISNASKTKERESFINYFPTYDHLPVVFFVPKGSKDLIKTYDDLYKYKIGIERGAYHFEIFDQDKKINKYELTEKEQLLKMLALKRIDAFAGFKQIDSYYIKKLDLEDKIEEAPFKLEGENQIYFGMSKKSAFIKQFSEFNRTFQEMINDGFIEKVKKKFPY